MLCANWLLHVTTYIQWVAQTVIQYSCLLSALWNEHKFRAIFSATILYCKHKTNFGFSSYLTFVVGYLMKMIIPNSQFLAWFPLGYLRYMYCL